MNTKVTAVDAKVDIVEASANASALVGVASDVQINQWIGDFGVKFDLLVKKIIDVIFALMFPRIKPLKSFFAFVGLAGVFTLSSLQLEPPMVEANLLSQIEALEHASAAGGSSTCPTQYTTNTSPFAPQLSFAPPYGGS